MDQLNLTDARPATVIAKVNEIVLWIEEHEEREVRNAASVLARERWQDEADEKAALEKDQDQSVDREGWDKVAALNENADDSPRNEGKPPTPAETAVAEMKE